MKSRKSALSLLITQAFLLVACVPASTLAPVTPPASPIAPAGQELPTGLSAASPSPGAGSHVPPDLMYISPQGAIIAQSLGGTPRTLAQLPNAGRGLDAIEARGKLYILAERALLEVDPAQGASRTLVDLDPPALFGSLLPLGGETLLYSLSFDAWQSAGLGVVDVASGLQRFTPGEAGYIHPVGIESWNNQLIGVPRGGDPQFPEFSYIDLFALEPFGNWPTSGPPDHEYGEEYAAISSDGRFLAFSTSRSTSADEPPEFRLSLYEFAAEPARLQSFALPMPPSHVWGGILAAPDNHNFYFMLRPGGSYDDPPTAYGLWRFDAASGEFAQVADLPEPDLHLASIEPGGEWLLLQRENYQPLYVHLPSGEVFPFDLDASQVALLVRRPIPAEVEAYLPEPAAKPTSTPVLPAISGTFEMLGHAGGNLMAVALDAEHAYLAVGPRLVVLAFPGSRGPQEIFRGEPLPAIASDLALAGGRLYWLGAAGRLLVFDVTSPDQPTLLSELPIPPGGQAIVVQGDHLYIAEGYSPAGASENALRIYDCSDPLNLVRLGSLALPNQAVDLTVDGGRAYVTLWAGSLLAVDVTDPANPAGLHSLENLHGAYVQPPYLFAAEDNLTVYDLSLPGEPQPLVSWPPEKEPRLNSVVAGATYREQLYLFDILSVCGGDVSQSCPASFHVLDVSEPVDPRSLSGPIDNPQFDRVEWAQVQGDRLFVRDYHGLSALSLSAPAHPALLWRYPTGATVMEAYDLTVRDGFIYLGTNLARHSLYVFDLRNLSGPRLSGPFPPSIATSGALSGTHLYLAQGPDGLSVLDVSLPDAPQEVARLDGSLIALSGDLRRPLALVGDTLYASLDVTPGGGSLGILDVADPSSPQFLGSIDLGGMVGDLAAGPGHLYALAGGTLHVLDVSDPHAPQILASLELPGASQLALSGGLAFVSGRACLNADNTGGLAVISLAEPDKPAVLSTPPEVPCGVLDIAAQDGVAILAAGGYGFLGVDVSDPAAPRLAYRFTTPSVATRVALDGERIYALDEQAGIYVLRLP